VLFQQPGLCCGFDNCTGLQVVSDKEVQACFDGTTLADLLELERIAADRVAASKLDSSQDCDGKDSEDGHDSGGGGVEGANKLAQRMALFRGVGRMVGVRALADKAELMVQLEKLAALRAELIAKLGTRKARESLLELRKYRRPPRAAAQVCLLLSVSFSCPILGVQFFNFYFWPWLAGSAAMHSLPFSLQCLRDNE
jgi:hypothetical protein